MELRKPETVVHSIQHLARGAQAEKQDVRAQDSVRATEQRVQMPPSDEVVRYEKLRKDADGALVTNGRVDGHSVDSAEAYEIVKNANTQTDLKISRWSEIAGYMRWGTLGLMASSFTWLSVGLGIGAGGAAGGAVASTGAVAATVMGISALPAAAAFGVAALIVGAATLFATQHVRKLQADRWMDVQGFMQERAATKIGQQVAQSLGAAPEVHAITSASVVQGQRSDGKRWQDVAAEQATQSPMAAR